MTAATASAGLGDRLEAEDLARARWYSFFSRWFLAPPDRQALDLFIPRHDYGSTRTPVPAVEAETPASPPPEPAGLSSPVESRLGSAWKAFTVALAGRSPAEMKAAYDETFISVGEAPVSLHACVYLTGFSNERPLAELRQWLAGQGIQGTESGLLTEDHLGLLCEAMAWLIIGPGNEAADRRMTSPGAGDAAQQFLFERFVAPVSDEFCRRLAGAPEAGVYRELGQLFAAFCAVERQAFDIER